jgi:hypothetical protein
MLAQRRNSEKERAGVPLFLASPETDLAAKSVGDRTPVKDGGGWPTAKRDGDDLHRSEWERERGAAVSNGGRTPVKRCREGDDRDDGRRRQIRLEREREREVRRRQIRSERERERGCGRRFRRRRRTPVKQRRQGDDPRPIWPPEISEREGGACVGGDMKFHFPLQPVLKQKKRKMKRQNKNSFPRQLVVSLL